MAEPLAQTESEEKTSQPEIDPTTTTTKATATATKTVAQAYLPPGPTRIPILGNVFIFHRFLDAPNRRGYIRELAEYYGKIFQLKIGPMEMVWLTELDTVRKAFEMEAFSDRYKESEPMENLFGKGIMFTNYGECVKERRSVLLECMKPSGLAGPSLEARAAREAELLVQALANGPMSPNSTDFHQSLVRLVPFNVISSFVFGRRFEYGDEEFVGFAESIEFLLKQQTTAFRKMALLQYLPSVQRALEMERTHNENALTFIQKHVDITRKSFGSVDLAAESFVQHCVALGETSAMAGESLQSVIMEMFMAGTKTQNNMMMWNLIYLIHNPDVQSRCRQEIKEASKNELDNKNSRFVQSTIREVMRINCLTASIRHIAREDTLFEGYRIPKDAMIFSLIPEMHFDETAWKDPTEFNPDRWLGDDDDVGNENGDNDENAAKSNNELRQCPHFAPFSVGKRRCPGENLAMATIAAVVTGLLRRFRLEPEDSGNLPSLKGMGPLLDPEPFRMILVEDLE